MVVDPIHGDIHLTDLEWRVVDTGSFQRLRHIKQLGMGHVTYPGATHTRFAHSLGVLGIMGRILEVAPPKLFTLPRERDDLRLAALLHDIGHYPYSHLMEDLDRLQLTEELVERKAPAERKAVRTPYPSHVELGRLIVTSQGDLIEAIGSAERAEKVADLFGRGGAANPQLSKLINSSFDMDRLDYLIRDSRAAGVPYGLADVNYLLNSLRVSPSGLVGVSAKALPAAEQFLFARYFIHRAVYFHKTTVGIEEACRQLLSRVRDAGKYGLPKDGEVVRTLVKSDELGLFTDAYVDRIIQEASRDPDPVVATLARAVRTRRPPKLLKEVAVLRERPDQHHAGTFFRQNCRHRLAELAQDKGIPVGQFLFHATKDLSLEERPALVTEQQARELAPEEADPVIKVFVGDAEEPTSILDISESIVSKGSGYTFQAFRLYVVYEGPDEGGIVEELRGRVKNWHEAR
jgi:HD superfamily phosphohydrolase